MNAYRRILIPVDGSPTSNKALASGLQIAHEGDGCVRLVHVVDELAYLTGFEASALVFDELQNAARRVLAEAEEIAKATGVPFESRFVDRPGARLGDVVADEASKWNADLIVVGTHGRRGISRVMLGSGAEQVIRLAPVPVLVIRGSE